MCIYISLSLYIYIYICIHTHTYNLRYCQHSPAVSRDKGDVQPREW